MKRLAAKIDSEVCRICISVFPIFLPALQDQNWSRSNKQQGRSHLALEFDQNA